MDFEFLSGILLLQNIWMGAVVFTKVKVIQTLLVLGPLQSLPLWCTGWNRISDFFCVLSKLSNRPAKFQGSPLGHWARFYVLNFECTTWSLELEWTLFNICLPFPPFGSFGSAYTVVPRIASKANVLNAKKEKES